MKRLILAILLCGSASTAFAVCPAPLTGKDAAGTTQNFGITVDGSGNCYGNVGIVDGSNAAAKASVKAGNTAATTDPAVVVVDANVLAAVQAATPAGENHTGEVGSNQIRVQVAQTVTSASAYASGNAIGGLMTVAGAARVSGALGAGGSGGILQNVAVNSKSVQTAAMEVWIFDANPTGSTCTDKTAFVLATADFDKVIGVAAVPTTVTNNSGWFSGGTGSVGQANNQAMAYDLSSATSLFACMVTRGTPTFTATTDISLKFQFLRD